MPVYRLLPIDECIIDPRYQRDKQEKHIEGIVNDFDEAQFQVLEASQRSDSEYAIFDGQQRLLARHRRVERGMEPSGVKLPALVHTGLSAEEEANLFVRLQDKRKPISQVDRFRARLFAKDPVAEGMLETAQQHRYKIGLGPQGIQAIVATERAYRRENLGMTLAVISKNWRGEPGALEASLIDGVSRFLLLYGADIDFDYLILKLEDVGPKTVLRRANDFRASASGDKAGGVLHTLRDLYSDRQHPLMSVEAAQKARTTKQAAGGRRRYVRVTREQVRDAAFALPDGFRIGDLQEALGGVSKAALTNARSGHLTKMLNAGTLAYRMPKDGELPGRHYYVPAPERAKVNRTKRRPPELDPPAGADAPRRGEPVRLVDTEQRRRAGSKPGEGKRMKDRDREFNRQQEARQARSEKDKSRKKVPA